MQLVPRQREIVTARSQAEEPVCWKGEWLGRRDLGLGSVATDCIRLDSLLLHLQKYIILLPNVLQTCFFSNYFTCTELLFDTFGSHYTNANSDNLFRGKNINNKLRYQVLTAVRLLIILWVMKSWRLTGGCQLFCFYTQVHRVTTQKTTIYVNERCLETACSGELSQLRFTYRRIKALLIFCSDLSIANYCTCVTYTVCVSWMYCVFFPCLLSLVLNM
jgi:hypothetical protein